jgi:hypothetical protein
MNRITESLARPGRTAGQGSLAFAIVETIDSFGGDFTTRQYGALLLLLTIIIGFLQVQLEDRLGKALLRTVPAPEQAEVLSDASESTDGVTYETHQTARMMQTTSSDGQKLDYLVPNPAVFPVPEPAPVQTDNRTRPEDGPQLPFHEATEGQWTGKEMR